MVKAYNFGKPIKYFDLRMQNFLGVDFANYASEVHPSRSPEAVNIFSSENGIIEKRRGWQTEHIFRDENGEPQKINAMFSYPFQIDLISGNILRNSAPMNKTNWTEAVGTFSVESTAFTPSKRTMKLNGSISGDIQIRQDNSNMDNGNVKGNEDYVASCWIKNTHTSFGASNAYVRVQAIVYYADSTIEHNTVYTRSSFDNNGWHYVEKKFTTQDKQVSYIRFLVRARNCSGGSFYVSSLKLQVGLEATSWDTPQDRVPYKKDVFLVHAGKHLYSLEDGTWEKVSTYYSRLFEVGPYYDWVEDVPSKFILIANDRALWVGHGKVIVVSFRYLSERRSMRCHTRDLSELNQADGLAYTPTTVISRSPTGGGTPYEPINVLSYRRKNSFITTANTRVFQLDASGLMPVVMYADQYFYNPVYGNQPIFKAEASVLQADGSWSYLQEDTHFTLNRSTGVVTFNTAIPATPVTGMDNVVITFYKKPFYPFAPREHVAYGEYGFNGGKDYIFLGIGNKDVWIRKRDLYMSELNYAFLGSTRSRIMGYSFIDNYMLIHKQTFQLEPTLYLRSVNLDGNDEIIFPIKQGISGEGPIAFDVFESVRGEPTLLTESGINTVVTNDITDTRVMQERGYYVNRRLIQEEGIENATSIVFNNLLMVAVNDSIYVADSRKRTSEQDSFSESYQWEWYFWKGIKATNFLERHGNLWAGDADGRLKRWKTKDDLLPYSDTEMVINSLGVIDVVNTPVNAWWRTPIFFMDNITAKKSLKNLWVSVSPYQRSGVEIYYKINGESKFIKRSNADWFNFEDIDFERFTFNTDSNPQVIVTNRVERQFMSIQFMFANGLSEPFGLLEAVARYRYNSEYKGG